MPLGMIPNGAQKNIFFKEDITMGMVVQHNMNAINSYNKLNANVAGMKKSSEKLSSGYRINRAGDDAAGLAVSEKMRSQIKGLNQAIRNSQDGINMIQTFEGAAQETHSILQRMKELASQSANGTYDNATDRAAIQLEFNQLNDELNQIADTDFNGTIVLNGGQMADGLKATNIENGIGEFNYKTKVEDAAAAAAADAEALKNAGHFSGDAVGAIVDNSKYNKTQADIIWNKLGLDAKSTDVAKPDEIQVTFTYDGNKWQATGVADKDGKAIEVSADKLKALSTTAVDKTGSATGKGGFTIDGTDINAIFDTSNAGKYDTATIKFQNVKADNKAPANAGLLEDSFDIGTVTAGDASKVVAPTVAINETNVTDATMDADMKAVFDALKNVEFTLSYAAGTPTIGGTFTAIAADPTNGVVGGNITMTNGVISYTKTGGAAVEIATITASNIAGLASNGGKFKLNFDSYNYVDPSDLEAKSVALPDSAKPTAGMFDIDKGGVSKSDAFENSTAIMTYANNITLQVGARTKDAVNFTFEYNKDGTADMGDLKANLNLSARADGLNTENLSLATAADANHAIDQIDKAINKTSMVRASFGSIQNRLEHKITNLTTTSENLTEAESSIRDTDMASEMMNYTKMNILQQAAQSMLAQANQQPQSILQLLG